MPLIKDTETELGMIQQPPPIPDVTTSKDVDFFREVIPAALTLDNSIVSELSNESPDSDLSTNVDLDYDVWSDVVGTRYEPYWSDFAMRADNQIAANKIKEQVDGQIEAREIMNNASLPEAIAATALAVLTDPIAMLLPINRAKQAASFAKRSMLSNVQHFAVTGAMSEAASELALQSSQVTRSTTESVSNIAAGTFIGGVIGGATFKSLEKTTLKSLEKGLEKDFTIPASIDKDKYETFIDDSIGAARTLQTTLEQETLKPALGLEKALRGLSPNLRLPQSPSIETRRIGQQLLDNPLFFNKHAEGITEGPSSESLMQRFTSNQVKAIEGLRGQYSAYKKAIRAEGLPNLSKTEFDEQVAIALRNNDIGRTQFVTDAAKSIRKELFDPLKKEAIEQDLLPKDVIVETADSYFTRIWETKKIIANEPEFRDIVGSWVKSEAETSVRKFNFKFEKIQKGFRDEIDELKIAAKRDEAKIRTEGKLTDAAKKTIKELQTTSKKKISALEKKLTESEGEQRIDRESIFDTDDNFADYTDNVTDEIVQSLTQNGGISPHFDIKVTSRGPLKERTFNIPDKMVDGSNGSMNFISNDVERILERYRRVLGADIELKRRFGSVTLDDQIEKIRSSYKKLSEDATTENQRLRLNKRLKQDIEDIEVTRDLLRGVPTKYTSNPDSDWVRAFKFANTLNYVRLLGGVTVSSIPDVARPVMIQGFARVFGDGLIPLITNLKAVKMSVQEAKNAGAVTEMILNTRVSSMADLADPYAHGTAFERFSDHTAQTFSKATGIMHWNHFWKSATGVMTQARILDGAVSGKIADKDREYLALLGLDKSMISRIGKQFNKHGESVGGVKIAGTDNWDDEVARRAYQAAIITDVNRTIVTKGVGDVPLVMNSQVGKTLGQFKSFALAANQRVTISGLQQRDMAMLNGVVFSMAAGMAVYVLKEFEKGREPDLSPENLLVQGLDRSGLMPVIMEVNNMAEKLGIPGLARASGAAPSSRFASRNITGTLIGPTGGLIQDIGVSTRAIATGEVNESDVRTMRRLIPFNNLIILRKIFDKAEEAAR